MYVDFGGVRSLWWMMVIWSGGLVGFIFDLLWLFYLGDVFECIVKKVFWK